MTSRATQPSPDVEDELVDLQRRFHLLEGDRKAFMEASQWTIKQNKDTLELVKRENRELRAALSNLQKEKQRSRTEKPGLVTVEKLSEDVHELKKRYNDLKHLAAQKQSELEAKQDILRETQREGTVTTDADHPTIKSIRVLETKLERATAKCREVEMYQRIYKHMKKRLKDQRAQFDGQLTLAQQSLKAKQTTLSDLELVNSEASRSRDAAKAELQRLEEIIDEERRVRDRELSERRKLVQAKIELNQRIEKRERKRREAAIEAEGENVQQGVGEGEGEQALIKNYISQGFYTASADQEILSQREKVSIYENAFRRIKEATGIEDINEVISKFLTQDETASNLSVMIKDAQARIEALSEDRARVLARVEELRYSGVGSLGSRRIVDEYDAKLSEANSKCERLKKRYDRYTKLLVNGCSGIEHLVERLGVVKLDEKQLRMNALAGFAPPVTETNVLDALRLCEIKLNVILETRADGVAPSVAVEAPVIPKLNIGAVLDLPANNLRVALSDDDDSGEDIRADDDDGVAVLDRVMVKEKCLDAIERAVRKNKLKAKKKASDDAVFDEKSRGDEGVSQSARDAPKSKFAPRPPPGSSSARAPRPVVAH